MKIHDQSDSALSYFVLNISCTQIEDGILKTTLITVTNENKSNRNQMEPNMCETSLNVRLSSGNVPFEH